MKNPLYKQILKGIFLCVFLLCILAFALAFIHDRNLQKMDRDNFFRESILASRFLEQEYLHELELVQASLLHTEEAKHTKETPVRKNIAQIISALNRHLSRGLKGFGLPNTTAEHNYPTTDEFRSLNGKAYTYEEFFSTLPSTEAELTHVRTEFSRLCNNMEKALRTDPQLILLINRLKRELANISELIGEEDLELQYFSTEISALIYKTFGKINAPEVEQNILTAFDLKSVGNEAFRNLIIILILRTFQNNQINSFAGPLRSFLEFSPENFNMKFFAVRLVMLHFSCNYKGIELNKEHTDFLFPNKEKLLDPFAGYLTATIRTDRIFERRLNQAVNANNGTYRFFTNRGFMEYCNNPALNNLSLFFHDVATDREQASSFAELYRNFSSLREVQRFRWQDNDGWHYGLAVSDAVFGDYIHWHEIPQDKFIHYRTVNNAFRLLCFFFLLFMLGFFFAFQRISQPLYSFASSIQRTVKDFSEQHIKEFIPVFAEFQLMQLAFLQTLKQVNRNIFLREALLTVQNLIRDEITPDIFHSMVSGIYRNCFSLDFKHYDYELDELQLENLSSQEEISKLAFTTVGSVEERSLFDEQVRFYYRKIILEQEFADSLLHNREFELAQQVQLNLQPKVLPRLDDYEISTFYQAARFLAGDFFEVIQKPEKSVFIIADVSGKGFGSALFGAAVKALFQAYYQRNIPLEEVFGNLNNALIKHFHQHLFCTCFAVEKIGDRITFCSAGHNNMYLVKKEEITALWAEGLPFGLLENCKYKRHNMEFKESELLFLYTDGCSEAENIDKQLFGDEALKHCIAEHYKFRLPELNDSIYGALLDFARGVEQSDDISYMLIRRLESQKY